MRLFIAEKPSLGRAIADVLPKPLHKSQGYITAANGDVVSWCIGHLLEQVSPESYNAKYKKWSHEHLPIVPQKWQLGVKSKTAKQLSVLRRLLKKAKVIIHAGDPDREGQLLVDEVIHFLGVSSEQKSQVLRCLISDLNPSAVRKAVSEKGLRSNRDFLSLSTSALARSRADWLYGINLTRAYTLQGQKAGYQGVLSVGRVQTPVLGLVVRRDQAISDFISKAYYQVWATLICDNGQSFKAKWLPSDSCKPYLDDQGRNINEKLAQNVVNRINAKEALVIDVKRQLKTQPPPLPFNLSALQIDANKAYGLSAQQVLDVCQALYERHKLITYPRSDCRHLPKNHFSEARNIIETIKRNSQNKQFNQAPLDHSIKSRAWNDSKISAHHAIVPTDKQTSLEKLSLNESKVYQLVCRNYLAQFLPNHEFYQVIVRTQIETGIFETKAKQSKQLGWKCIFNSKKITKEEAIEEQTIPELTVGQKLNCTKGEVIEKKTSPPKMYTEATLLAAMTGISAHVSDPQLKKILKDTDGLGTEATRAGIIELLFKRQYLRRQGKTVTSTLTGKALINALPASATHPDLTALWESKLNKIYVGTSSYKQLMEPLESQLSEMVRASQNVLPKGLNGLSGAGRSIKKKPTYKKRPEKHSKTKPKSHS